MLPKLVVPSEPLVRPIPRPLIDNRCMAADGPVTPTLSEATADELRKLYLFADRIRKGQI